MVFCQAKTDGDVEIKEMALKIKEDLKILDKPRVMNSSRANILAQMAAIALLLKRAFAFIVKFTNLFRKLHETNDPEIRKKLTPPSIPKSIQNIVQLE